MKLVSMTCPSCGANIQVDTEKKLCFCMYCGAQVLIDDEKHHVVYDNAEESGYQFEIGRQKAQEDIRREKLRAELAAKYEAQRKAEEAKRLAEEEQARQYYAALDEQNRQIAFQNGTLCAKCGSYNCTRKYVSVPLFENLYSWVYCLDCGNTWRLNEKDYILKMIILWIMFFPITLTVVIVKSKKLPGVAKGLILAVYWIIQLFIWFAIIGSVASNGG